MSMHGWGGPAARMGMRSMRQDRSILQHRIKKGTLPRVLKFAKHYRTALIIFLTVVIIDAAISSVSPLLLREIIDVGIYDHRVALVIGLAVTTAVLAIFDAGLQMV